MMIEEFENKQINNIFVKIENEELKVISVDGMNFDEFCIQNSIYTEYHKQCFIESLLYCPFGGVEKIYQLKGRLELDTSCGDYPHFIGVIYKIID